jgi:hypothetical protein
MVKKRTKYEHLPFKFDVMAEAVCSRPYTGEEWSVSARPSSSEISEIDGKRQRMTASQVREFADICDARCKASYEARTPFLQRIIDAEDGRDELYMWLTHWLTSYLMNPEQFRRYYGFVLDESGSPRRALLVGRR